MGNQFRLIRKLLISDQIKPMTNALAPNKISNC